MYSREEIEKVRTAVDIVEVVREYVPSLNVTGRSAKGLCPFHNEKTPSFHLQPEKGFFKCFGCGEAGDVIAFISKIEQVAFTEALERLASQAGVVLNKERVNSGRVEPEGMRERLWRILETAKNFYSEQLRDEKAGEAARAYLKEREIREETVRDFQLGFSPTSGESIIEVLVRKNYSIELCQQAGLAVRSAAGRFYDPLFGRLVFPIFDSFGHTVGFGGRTLPNLRRNIPGLTDVERDDGPKYLNSPETPVFSKGKLLYGLSQGKAAILSTRRAVLLEGYMDVVGLHQGGFKAAVATLGTALTRDHAKLLKRYADEAVAFFDADEAGRKATVRGLEPLLLESIFPRVVMTTETKDPDEILLEQGPEYFEELLKKAPDFVDYLLKVSGFTKESPLEEKSRFAGEMLGVIGQSPNEILKAEWIGRIASALGFQTESLLRELGRKGPSKVPGEKPVVARPLLKPGARMPTVEEEYLQYLFTHGSAALSEDLEAIDFGDERQKRLFSFLKTQIVQQGQASLPEIFDATTESDREWVSTLLMEEKRPPDDEAKDRLVRNIKMKRDKEKLAMLSQRVGQGELSPGLMDEYKNLLKKVKGSTLKVGI